MTADNFQRDLTDVPAKYIGYVHLLWVQARHIQSPGELAWGCASARQPQHDHHAHWKQEWSVGACSSLKVYQVMVSIAWLWNRRCCSICNCLSAYWVKASRHFLHNQRTFTLKFVSWASMMLMSIWNCQLLPFSIDGCIKMQFASFLKHVSQCSTEGILMERAFVENSAKWAFKRLYRSLIMCINSWDDDLLFTKYNVYMARLGVVLHSFQAWRGASLCLEDDRCRLLDLAGNRTITVPVQW